MRVLTRTWDALGSSDPMWAVLSHADKRGNRWQLEEFLHTGVVEVAEILAYVRRLVPDSRVGTALDFGCGPGRLTQALGDHFADVHGVDVAPSMVARARELNRHGERCTYWLNQASDLRLFEDDRFDFVNSIITLQHMPPRLALGYVRELVRVLAPGGVLVFQLPGELRGDARSRAHRLLGRAIGKAMRLVYCAWQRGLRREPVMDMFGVPRPRVEALLRELGCDVVDVMENTSAGPHWTSFRYCARKHGGESGSGRSACTSAPASARASASASAGTSAREGEA